MTRPLEVIGAGVIFLLILGGLIASPSGDPVQALRGEVEMLRREVAAARSACTTEHAAMIEAHDRLAAIVQAIDEEMGDEDEDDDAPRPVRSVYARYAGRR